MCRLDFALNKLLWLRTELLRQPSFSKICHMKKKLIIGILFIILIVNHIYGQQESPNKDLRMRRFTLFVEIPGIFIYKIVDDSKEIHWDTNMLKSLGTAFEYNFSENLSAGLQVSFIKNHTKYEEEETKIEERQRSINFGPMLKLHLGRNQMFVPYLELSYLFCLGAYDIRENNDILAENYQRHVFSGGVGFKLYASRWFKKTKEKNNFGIDIGVSKSFLIYNNSQYAPLIERGAVHFSLFYKL